MGVTLRDAVLRTELGVFEQAKKILREDGIISLIGRGLLFGRDLTKRFFLEYLPLKYYLLSANSNGEIQKEVQGSQMVLNLNDEGISRELALYGVHESNSTREVKRLVKPGMKILEVGANIGYYAILETKLAGKDGFLYAFEPSPFNVDLLERNLALNGIKNCEVHGKAAGAENMNTKFFVAKKSNLSSFIQRDGMDMADMAHEGKIIDVDVVRLDDFFSDKDIDFIRMDVEGYEREILKGAEKLLTRENPPKNFFIEVHSELLHKKNSSAKEIIDYLRQYGYEVIKSFYRGRSDIVTASTEELLGHPLLEKGYWETFFEYKK